MTDIAPKLSFSEASEKRVLAEKKVKEAALEYAAARIAASKARAREALAAWGGERVPGEEVDWLRRLFFDEEAVGRERAFSGAELAEYRFEEITDFLGDPKTLLRWLGLEQKWILGTNSEGRSGFSVLLSSRKALRATKDECALLAEHPFTREAYAVMEAEAKAACLDLNKRSGLVKDGL